MQRGVVVFAVVVAVCVISLVVVCSQLDRCLRRWVLLSVCVLVPFSLLITRHQHASSSRGDHLPRLVERARMQQKSLVCVRVR